MTVKNLANVSFNDIISCFLAAFKNYYVPMPTDIIFYKERWQAAKVDFNLSYGMFDGDKLVGFIIHAIDKRNDILTAYNTGTGVIPEYRGKKIVQLIYNYALNDLAKNGINKSTLEVITKNEKAIRAYKSIGFKVCKNYKCFSGKITIENDESIQLKKMDLKNVDWNSLPNQQSYSWDNQKETLLRGNFNFYYVLHNNTPESYFIIKNNDTYLAQFDVLNENNIGWNRLFIAMNQVSNTVRTNNVADNLKNKLHSLKEFGLKNTVDQYEMELTF